MSSPEAKIAYLPKGYPRISETFVSNEILSLERLGLELEIFALKRPAGSERQPSARAVRAPVTYVPERVLRALPWLVPVHLLLCLRRPRRYARALGWCLSRCLREHSTTTLRRFLQAGWLAGWGLRGRRFAHFHAHFCHGPATVAMFVKWLTGSSYSFTAHAKDLFLTPSALLRQKMREAEFVVTCTEHNRRHLEAVGGDLVRVHRIYHGVDLQRFVPAPAAPAGRERAVAPTGGEPLVLSVGRLVEKKGFDTLVRACALLRARGQRFRCRIYGEGPLRGELLELVRELGLAGTVELAGGMLQDDLAGEYARADVFTLPCRVLENGDRDGLPNVLVEAQACGLPVVTTGVSGIPELVSHGVNGLLVPSDDPAALAEHLGVLLGDAALRRRLGEAGRRKVEAEFALEANARRLYGLFQRVLDLPQAPAVTRGTAGNPPARRGRAAKPDKLPTLAQACDPERMRALLVEILHAEGVAGVEVEVLHRRKRRCVLRYRVRWGAEAPREASCIGKVYAGDRGLPVYELMQALARHGFARDAADGVSIPAAEAYVPELGLLVQEEVGGSPVGAYIGTAEEEYAVRRLGAAVAKLHRSPLRPGEPWGLAQHLGRCHPSPRTLVAAVPELRREVDALVAGAARHLGEHPVRHWALLHGDLHLAQVHVARQRTWLIDLDACCVGDPAADLGNVLVFLSAKCRRHGRRALREALLDAYCREMPEEILERVPAFEALTHLRRACKRLRLQERGWRRKARRAVHAGLGCLAHAAERRGGGVHG